MSKYVNRYNPAAVEREQHMWRRSIEQGVTVRGHALGAGLDRFTIDTCFGRAEVVRLNHRGGQYRVRYARSAQFEPEVWPTKQSAIDAVVVNAVNQLVTGAVPQRRVRMDYPHVDPRHVDAVRVIHKNERACRRYGCTFADEGPATQDHLVRLALATLAENPAMDNPQEEEQEMTTAEKPQPKTTPKPKTQPKTQPKEHIVKKDSTPTVAEMSKTERYAVAKAERAALKEWEAKGSKGKRPATPALDAIAAEHQQIGRTGTGAKKTARKASGERAPRADRIPAEDVLAYIKEALHNGYDRSPKELHRLFAEAGNSCNGRRFQRLCAAVWPTEIAVPPLKVKSAENVKEHELALKHQQVLADRREAREAKQAEKAATTRTPAAKRAAPKTTAAAATRTRRTATAKAR